jgi:hypothetical protein
VAPDPEKKWMIILWYDTSNTARIDPEDRKYDWHQRYLLRNLLMLPEQIPERDELNLWKLFRRARSASNGVSIREYKCLMLINQTAGQVCALCVAMVLEAGALRISSFRQPYP